MSRFNIKNNPLRLAEDRILVEQLRLLLGNVGSSVIPAFLLAILMLWVLYNDTNASGLWLWCAAVMLSKLTCYLHARHYLASDIPFVQARHLVWVLMILHTVDGALWGGLAWITMDTTSLTGSILVISVAAGIAGSSMSLLSPVLPVFIVFVVTELFALATKLVALGDPAYNALGVAGILFVATLIGQARNSTLAARVSIEGQDELRRAQKIVESANHKLADQNVLLEKMNILLRHNEISLAEAKQKAEESSNAKSKFLAAASHDLRQPLHAQGLFLSALSNTELTPHQSELIAKAKDASKATNEMLNELLDYSRIEAGVIEPKLQAFRLQPLFNKLEREFELLAEAKGLAYRSRKTSLVVQSDPMLVEFILRNLLANAIRYTSRGGLLVACRKRGGQAVLEVWDTGIGIDPLYQQEVFYEFHQLDTPERDSNKGLGLGLAIAQGLAHTLESHLSLASTPHRGSVFRLSLPITTAALPIEKALPNYAEIQLKKLRVLVVDDDETVRSAMLYQLRNWGFKCVAAENIEEALTLAHIQAPDVVICDYRLREQHTGLQAVAALRALLGDGLPALLITGDTAPDRLREAQASGVPLLHKPVLPGRLYQKLLTILPA